MPQAAQHAAITVDEYLAGERVSLVRHAYVDGEVFAMAGASKAHNRLTKRLARLCDDRLAATPCEAFTTDVKVRVRTIDQECFYYPDLYVECAPYTADPYYSERPVLIVEVLSDSTERADRSDKFYAYRKLPTLQEYVLVAQDEPRIEVYRRATGWDLEVYGPGQRLRLEALGGDLDLDAVYAGILPLPAAAAAQVQTPNSV